MRGRPVAAEVVAGVLGQLDDDARPEAFYDDLCAAVCDVVGAERAIVFLYDRDLRRVRAVGAHRIDAELFDEVYVTPDSAAVVRIALQEDRVVDVDDEQDLEVSEQFRPLVRGRRVACAPMVAAGHWVGVLLVDRPADAPDLSPEERHVLWTLGKASALAAIARSGTRQAERARQLEQRIHLAREVHDNVIQRLFGVSLVLSGEGTLGAGDRERCGAEVQAALGELRSALQRPLGREPKATAASFPEEVARLAAAHPELGLAWTRDADVPAELEAVAQSALLEGVRNARKHAEPTSVTLRTARLDGALLLEVGNDGARSPRRGATGMGLRLLAFEALSHGGFAEFGPRDGGRWVLRLVVPVRG